MDDVRFEELRQAHRNGHVASASMACPECDAPVAPIGRMRLRDALGCPFCAHAGPVRDFLSLSAPQRPARVVVRVVAR